MKMKYLLLVLSTLLLANFVSAEVNSSSNCSGQLEAEQEVIEVAKSTAITPEIFLFGFSSGLEMVTAQTIAGGTDAFTYHLDEAAASAKYGEPAFGVILLNRDTKVKTIGLVTTVPIKDSDDSVICVADGLQVIP